MTFAGNDTQDSQLMEIEDANGALSYSSFVGGTVLRTIVDIVLSPTYNTSYTSPFTLEAYFHLGMGMTPETAPDLTVWDPNTPHADFMFREMAVETWYGRSVTSQAMQSKHSSSHGQRMHWDSVARRKIRENDRMWIFGHYFTLDSTGGAIGYSGRQLIALP